MLKKWSKTALLAAMAVLMLTVMGACSDDDDDDNNSSSSTTKTEVKLPAKVGTDPFTSGTYKVKTNENHNDMWRIYFAEDEDAESVSGNSFKIKNGTIQFDWIYEDEDEVEPNYLMAYTYDSEKGKIYMALSKIYEWDENDNPRWLTKDEYVRYWNSLRGQTFVDDGEEWSYTDEEINKWIKDIENASDKQVTYGYEKTDDGIKLTLESPKFDWSDTEPFTLVRAD